MKTQFFEKKTNFLVEKIFRPLFRLIEYDKRQKIFWIGPLDILLIFV